MPAAVGRVEWPPTVVGPLLSYSCIQETLAGKRTNHSTQRYAYVPGRLACTEV